MRQRFLQATALVIGLLGIPSLVWQICGAWPPGELQLQFFGLQAIVIGVFVAYGLGWAYCSPSVRSSEEIKSQRHKGKGGQESLIGLDGEGNNAS